MAQSAEDKLILKQLDLLDTYVSLRAELSEASSNAFVKLARARYHGATIDATVFKEAFDAHLKVSVLGGNKHFTLRDPTKDANSDSAKSLEDQLADVTIDVPKTKSDGEDKQADPLIKSVRSKGRPKTDPIKNIFGAMPPTAIRQSQQAFSKVVECSFALLNAQRQLEGVERQLAEVNIKDQKASGDSADND